MILQINKGNKRIYQEAECITLSEIDLFETSGYSKNDLIETLNLEVNPENKTYFDMDGVLSDEKLKNEKMVKVAVLSDGEVSNNNRTLIFSGNTTIYLLNNSGKTIQRF